MPATVVACMDSLLTPHWAATGVALGLTKGIAVCLLWPDRATADPTQEFEIGRCLLGHGVLRSQGWFAVNQPWVRFAVVRTLAGCSTIHACS